MTELGHDLTGEGYIISSFYIFPCSTGPILENLVGDLDALISQDDCCLPRFCAGKIAAPEMAIQEEYIYIYKLNGRGVNFLLLVSSNGIMILLLSVLLWLKSSLS